MKTIRAVLTEARALIADPDNWTKRASARNSVGTEVSPHHEQAVCFCITGALERVIGPGALQRRALYDKSYNALKNIGKVTVTTLPGFNDMEYTEHYHILDLFDRTIAVLSDED